MYQKCGGRHTKCTTGQGQKINLLQSKYIEINHTTITAVNESIDKVQILDEKLGDDNNKEYKVCCFIHEKTKAKLRANEKEKEERKRKREEQESP